MVIPHWAKVGAKVVCVTDCALPESSIFRPEWMPVKGGIYTISGIAEVHGFAGVELEEQESVGWVYLLRRFRPLITLEDDMKLFEHLKNPSLVDKLDLLAERMDLLYKEQAGR